MRTYFTRPLALLLILYFASGLPLALTASTLAAWLHDSHVDISTIGLFAFAATPYTLKFLWSPLIDALPFPFLSGNLGRRRGWILATQILLALALVLLAFTTPDINPLATAVVALLVAFLSASQDIVIDAYRVEILPTEEQGKGAAVAQLGYRLGMIMSSAGALRLATVYGWQITYIIMAWTLLVGMAAVILAKEPYSFEGGEHRSPPLRSPSKGVVANAPPRTHAFSSSFIQPFIEFTKHPSWWLILLFVVIYKFADAFIGIVTNPFLLDIGFTKDQISYIVKIYGTLATLIGTFWGGTLVMRHGAIRIMFLAGFLHAITNLLYSVQAHVGADGALLSLSVIVENVSGGVSSAAFVAYLSGLCNRHYTATQYALLSSLAAFGRTWLSAPAGFVAKWLGWQWFFTLSALLALPGLLVLWLLQKRVK